ncbi:hypothetical protein IJ818_05560 [bacterium]|nr:hypothetical protein [bacterium]
MFVELLGAAMLMNADLDRLAYENPHAHSVEIVKSNYSDEYSLSTKGDSFAKFYSNHKETMKKVLEDFNSRKNKTEQYLKWTTLPQEQLNGHLAEIYSQANTLKSRKDKIDRPLVVLGIGGSKHTAEFLLNMTGQNNGNVYFYSDIDPLSFNNFINNTKVGVQNLNFLVVTKSGTTFETQDAFKRFEQELIDYYTAQGLRPKDARDAAQKHFAICTDKFAKENNLRMQIRNNPNYIQNLYIHDGVGGRYSMFDDAGLFVLAYAGIPQSYTARILSSAQKTSDKYTNPDNLDNNSAMKNAMFNVYARNKGYNILYQQYFGRFFEQGGENWAKQLYLESLKDFDFVASKAPDSMHYATEGLYDHENRKKYYIVMTTIDPDVSTNYKHYTTAIKDTYASENPMIIESLAVEGNTIKPEAIGEYIQTKHFETVFMGCARRALNKKLRNAVYLQYPEVVQFNVETYKKKFKIKKEDIYDAKDVNKAKLKSDYEKYNVVPGRKD